MRKLILFLLFTTSIFSQTADYKNLKSKGSFETYITKSGKILKVKDTIQIGLPSAGKEFVFITQGNVGAAAFLARKKVIITSIKSIGNSNTGYKIYLLFKGFGILPVYIDYENAIDVGEI